jgi:hypothetical protein
MLVLECEREMFCGKNMTRYKDIKKQNPGNQYYISEYYRRGKNKRIINENFRE